MDDFISYLKSPELVVKVQEYFGIEYVKSKLNDSEFDSFLETPESERNSFPQKQNDVKSGNSELSKNSNFDHNSTSAAKHPSSKKSNLYIIHSKFWYYLFLIGTELGDELFYATFIPFWFWNIDGAVGRRVVFVWSSIMYIGQSLKDVIRWSRPGYPVVKLQQKWGMEYGMPSTHAMVGFSIPFSVVIFTHQRYQYPFSVGLILSVIWCSVICLSRIYLGMHSVLDIVAGLLLTVFLMSFLVPLVDFLDFYILSCIYSPIFVLFISIMLIVYYPKSDKWTPTRRDTTMVVSFCAGIQIGAWINYQMGDMVPTLSSPPYIIIWPTYQMLGLIILRTILGLCSVMATRAFAKSISYAFVCALLGKNKNEVFNSESSLENKNKTTADLCTTYVTCGLIGFITQYLLPNVFKLLYIGRPDFYTEI